jgi:hypothetical protein
MELVEQDKNPPVVSSTKREGLFSALLGDPEILLHDLLSDPSKYEEGVSNLVQDLASGQRSINDLEPHEMELLDRATIDFSQPRRSRQEPKPAPPPAPKIEPPEFDELVEIGEPMKLPPKLANAYWWLK